MKKRKHSSNKMLRLAGLLFYLVLVSTYITSGLYARYSVTSRGQDSARVAAFVFDVADSENQAWTLEIDNLQKPEDKVSALFKVMNTDGTKGNEVSVKYVLQVELEGSIPVQCTVNTANGETTSSVLTVNNFSDAGAIQKTEDLYFTVNNTENTGVHNYTIMFEWPKEYNTIEYAEGNRLIKAMVTISAEQMD